MAGLIAWGALMAINTFADGEWQFWNTDSIEHRFNERIRGRVETEFYFGDDMSDWFYRHVDVGASFKATDWFEAGLYYRFAQEKKNDEWKDENRPHLNATFMGKIGPVAWSDRNRFEYRMREGRDDDWRYRNRLRLSSIAKWTALKIQPYVDNEVFYDFAAEDWNQHRVSGGIATQPASWLKASVYYLLQTTRKDGEWNSTHILGLDLKLLF